MRDKIYDCITFFQENFITNLRFEILNEVVDYFVICESKYDHRGNKKRLNFELLNQKFKHKIIYLVFEGPFTNTHNLWENQAEQREYILKGLKNINPNDYIMFSDPDEIPRPQLLINLNLQKKYAIFLQKVYCYKFNLFNKYESPWEGTRVCRRKDLKSIDYMRQKIKVKNLTSSSWKLYKEKSIEVIENGGWHFNSLLNPKEISKKLKTFAHNEFSGKKYSDLLVIEKNIEQKQDLFGRGYKYEAVQIDNSFPDFLIKNLIKFKNFII